ncbi:DUF3859 domain-containing protein [Glaciecola sp. 1036]|uniref:DUF3859 domain-containing protein n=1 Tax=Alteromonadaceae TaxID=72275 RepID=UPI003CFC8809
MAKRNPVIELVSYGIYTQWDSQDKALPKIRQFTTLIPAQIDIEFGMVINVKRAKNKKIKYCIYHPNIPDKKGIPMPPFDGEEYIKSNDWHFYLGDTLWEPIDDKLGEWRMTIELDGEIIADKTFTVEEEILHDEQAKFWMRNRAKPRLK